MKKNGKFIEYICPKCKTKENIPTEVVEMLDCTEKTLRRYRNDGYLGYSRIGDKFYYTANDIILFLQRSHIDPYQYS